MIEEEHSGRGSSGEECPQRPRQAVVGNTRFRYKVTKQSNYYQMSPVRNSTELDIQSSFEI